MDAPHIFEYVDQDRIIEIYRGKWADFTYIGFSYFLRRQIIWNASSSRRFVCWICSSKRMYDCNGKFSTLQALCIVIFHCYTYSEQQFEAKQRKYNNNVTGYICFCDKFKSTTWYYMNRFYLLSVAVCKYYVVIEVILKTALATVRRLRCF
jgi:hypothetical protein